MHGFLIPSSFEFDSSGLPGLKPLDFCEDPVSLCPEAVVS